MTDTLLLADNFPPRVGGIARMMGELAHRYPSGSVLVSTGAYPGSAASDSRFPQIVDRVRIRATLLRDTNGVVVWAWRVGALARRYRPGFVWCAELIPAGYVARWLAKRQGIPYGMVVHGSELLRLEVKARRGRVRRWVAREILGGASVIVAISRWTAELARRVMAAVGLEGPAPPVRVVPLGTDPDHFRPGIDPTALREKYGLDGGPWLLTVARLEWHKGIDTVIRALPAIRAVDPAIRYAVAGEGSERPALEQLAAQLGVDTAVRFLGGIPDAELPSLYNAVDLYVGASRQQGPQVEGFGISLLEASASGLAVLAGRSGGVPDAVREGETGLLVDPDDPAAVAAEALRLLGDPELRRRLGAAGRSATETYYNWDRVAADFREIEAEFRLSPRLV